MKDLENAKEILAQGEYTCVLCKGGEVHTSCLRGVKPLVRFYESGRDFRSFSAADKVVGKGAAFLYALMEVEIVHAYVMSKPALCVLEKHGIKAEYSTLAESIVNRRGDGICPFEEAVLDMDDKFEALTRIKEKMQELNIE